MKLINQSAQYLPQQAGIDGIYKQIELAGRTSYLSWDKMTDDSAKKFVDMLIKSKHCYTGDTEVLTEKGWIKWKNYINEKIATINPDLSFKGYETPINVIHHNYSGKFYNYPSLGIEVTDGHKMFGVFRLSNNDFYANNNYQLFVCNSEYIDNNKRHKTNGERMFKTPRHCIKPNTSSPYMELVGFWLGDGCYNSSTQNKLTFHLKKERKIQYLKNLALKLGYGFEQKKDNNYKVVYKGIGKEFNEKYYLNNEKKIDFSELYSVEDIHSIMIGLINSDGYRAVNTKTILFTNTSKSIIDWVCTYAPLAGYSIIRKDNIEQTETQKGLYSVYILDTDYSLVNDSRNEQSKCIITENTKEVFCVTVSTGLIMVRGINGITTICGNCSVLEHGTVYLKFHNRQEWVSEFSLENSTYTAEHYSNNKYSKYCQINDKEMVVTTNLRVLQENGWLDDLKYLCEPTRFHEKRLSVKVITDIGVTREFNRHRTFSIVEQSTRYCNFSKDKFGNEITFIRPSWYQNDQQLNDEYGFTATEDFLNYLSRCENMYMQMIFNSKYSPQQARQVLPLCTKTEVVYTAFESDWRHFFDLRLFGKTGEPHPQMKQLAELIKQEFEKAGVWEGIMKYPSKYD